ncbi:MAG: leucyl aminopeptidase [Anaerolineae bacterium]
MEVLIQPGGIQSVDADAIVVNLFQGITEPGGATGAVDTALGGAIRDLIVNGVIEGRLNETAILFPRGAIPARRVIVAGLGPEQEFDLDAARQAAASAARTARDSGARTLASIVHGGGRGGLALGDAAQAVVEGTILGLYRYNAPGVKPPEEFKRQVDSLTLVEFDAARLPEIEAGAKVGQAVAEGTCLARDLANQPANVMTPTALATKAERIAADYGMSCQVFDREQMAELKMGALLSVARGAAEPPRFIVMEHNPTGSDAPPFVLVGKGITFDSGGISLKPSEGMEQMRGDMGGAAAVLGAMQAIGAINLPERVVALLPTTENMPGGTATHPGDVVTAMNDVTIEIINTDAEGRLILADALAYARQYKPAAIVDVATLTGGMVTALGHYMTGVFASDDLLWETIRAAGDAAGEPMWRMPLDPIYDRQITTRFADVKNTGGRQASPVTAARFLSRFVEKCPWAHLDIAGTSWWERDLTYPLKPYFVRGNTGVSVRTLVGVLRTWRSG